MGAANQPEEQKSQVKVEHHNKFTSTHHVCSTAPDQQLPVQRVDYGSL